MIFHLRNFSQFMIRTLNSLRFILILMIVISHSALPMSQGLHDYLGECPVAIFFVISGFVLSLSKGKKLEKKELSNKQFFLSRIFTLSTTSTDRSFLYTLRLAIGIFRNLDSNHSPLLFATMLGAISRIHCSFKWTYMVSFRHHILLPYIQIFISFYYQKFMENHFANSEYIHDRIHLNML